MCLTFETPKIRDLNVNGRLLPVDVPRARVPLVPQPVA
jgi:hypothetical protein